MLMDGAIDQTFAFGRQTHITLTAAKITHIDQLSKDVPSANAYFMNALAEIQQKRQVSVNEFLASEKQVEGLKQLVNETGVSLQ